MDKVLKSHGSCKVVEATHAHVAMIYPHLRKADKIEVACMGHEPCQSLLGALEMDDVTLTALRVGTCALMIHHGFDKIENVEGFSANVVAKFFGFLPGPPQFWTLSAAVTQIVGSGFLSIGLFARPVALSMLATMGTAVVFHLLNTGGEGFPLAVVKAHSYNYELAAMYVIVLGYFAAAGAGPLSVDEQILGGEIAFYQKLTFGAAEEELDA